MKLMDARAQIQARPVPWTSFTPIQAGLLQRKCVCGNHTVGGECEGCSKQEQTLQRATRNSGLETRNSDGVPPIVHEVLRSPGQPLDPAARTFFEPRFGQDFSRVRARTATLKSAQAGPRIGSVNDPSEQEADHVAERVIHAPLPGVPNEAGPRPRYDFSQIRVHTDAKAAESARAVNALAYTVGRDVVFGAGLFAPSTTVGKQLLGHELAHTVQQTDGISGLLIQRMAPCPSSPDPVPSGWKPYHGDSCIFHCCYRGILEDRRPTPDDPQNECFYDNRGNLVDQNHPYAGCGGTPNQYDSASDPLRHALIDRGGILRSGLGAFLTSRRHDFKPTECFSRCNNVSGPGKFFCFQGCMSAE
jgi:hypothetical protein